MSTTAVPVVVVASIVTVALVRDELKVVVFTYLGLRELVVVVGIQPSTLDYNRLSPDSTVRVDRQP